MARSEACFRRRADGIDVFVRLTPKSSSDAVAGTVAGADGLEQISVRVRAAPEKGAANAALERLLADWLGVPKRSVSVVAGSTSRQKTVRIAGDPSSLVETLEAALSRPAH
jgi:uncharacterized protein (TIGR00251 family)